MNTNQKSCKKCKETKPFSAFGKDKLRPLGLQYSCKECRSKEEHARRQNPEYKAKIKNYKSNPSIRRKSKDSALKRIFGITIDCYERMLDSQKGVCLICSKNDTGKSLAVDHCHTTGKVRGLLCTACNQGLGHFKDDIERVYNALNYLVRHK